MRAAEGKRAAEGPKQAALRLYKPASALLLVGAGLQALGLVASALVSRRVLDEGGGEWLCALLLLAALLLFLRAGMDRLAGDAVDRAASDLRRATLDGLLRKDAAAYSRFHSGQLFSRLTKDIYTICEWRIRFLPQTAGQCIRLAAAAAAVLSLYAPLLGIVLAAGAAALLLSRPYHLRLKRLHLGVRRADENLTGCAQEILEHLELLQGMQAGTETVRRFDRRQASWREERKDLRDLSAAGSAAFSAAVRIGYAALLFWGGASVRAGRMSFGDLAALAQLLGMFQAPVTGLARIPAQLAAVRTAETQMDEVWELPGEPVSAPLPPDAAVRAVVFDHVTFRYGERQAPVLQDFSARLPMDGWTCLTGASGSGKTTLLRLILGLYAPQAGRVYLETEAGDILCSASTRRIFGYVPQSPELFSGTIRENLLLARPESEEDELWKALDRAQCGFVRALPAGLDTALAEEGGGLSMGQRQRIAAARAMLSGARLLLLDEITSALDRETGEQLLTELRAACPAAVFATHQTDVPERMGVHALHLEGTAWEHTEKTEKGRELT